MKIFGMFLSLIIPVTFGGSQQTQTALIVVSSETKPPSAEPLQKSTQKTTSSTQDKNEPSQDPDGCCCLFKTPTVKDCTGGVKQKQCAEDAKQFSVERNSLGTLANAARTNNG